MRALVYVDIEVDPLGQRPRRRPNRTRDRPLKCSSDGFSPPLNRSRKERRGGGALVSGSFQRIQRHVQQQHVDARLTDKPKRAALSIRLDERAHLVLGQVARLGDRRDLPKSV